jgi:hypothetical protein
MSYNNGPKIVTNGLMFHLDAGNPRSYRGTGTTWTDLTRNGYNGSLSYDNFYTTVGKGSFYFDSNGNFIGPLANSFTTTNSTWFVWMRSAGAQRGTAGIFFSRSTTTAGINFYGVTGKINYHWNVVGLSYDWDSGLSPPTGAWCLVVLRTESTRGTMFMFESNKISSAVFTSTHSAVTLDDLKFGTDDTGCCGPRHFFGHIAMGSIYNRALSDAEIYQNFHATKGRFGF